MSRVDILKAAFLSAVCDENMPFSEVENARLMFENTVLKEENKRLMEENTILKEENKPILNIKTSWVQTPPSWVQASISKRGQASRGINADSWRKPSA